MMPDPQRWQDIKRFKNKKNVPLESNIYMESYIDKTN